MSKIPVQEPLVAMDYFGYFEAPRENVSPRRRPESPVGRDGMSPERARLREVREMLVAMFGSRRSYSCEQVVEAIAAVDRSIRNLYGAFGVVARGREADDMPTVRRPLRRQRVVIDLTSVDDVL